MARPRSTTPTEGELEILKVVWEKGVCTVRAVHETLSARRKVAHTTVASMMQLMQEKGLLELVEVTRPQRYRATFDADRTADVMINDLARRVFDESPKKLVVHLLRSRHATPEQIRTVETVLDEVLDRPMPAPDTTEHPAA